MAKKVVSIVIIGLLFVLAACSPAAAATPTPAPQASQGGNGNGGGGGTGTRPLNQETKLAIGIFKLEGSSNAVSADEAKTLLPLEQSVKTLSADPNTAQADIQAVYTQIQNALTADQVNAIDQMNLTQSDVQSMMQQMGIQITPGPNGFPGANGGTGGNGGTPFPTLSPDERATRTAQRQTQVASGGGNTGAGTPAPNGTPGFGGGGRGGFGLGNMFIDPLITLLQQRAGG